MSSGWTAGGMLFHPQETTEESVVAPALMEEVDVVEIIDDEPVGSFPQQNRRYVVDLVLPG